MQQLSSKETEAISENEQVLGPPPMAQSIGDVLEAAGVDEETVDAIKSDLRAAFEDVLSSGEFPPDPATMKETIDGVFAEYGLDASEILGEPGVKGGGGSPPPPPTDGYESTSTSDTATSLFELLQSYEQEDASASDMAGLLVDYLFGLDEAA